jgi:hypothetical protein
VVAVALIVGIRRRRPNSQGWGVLAAMIVLPVWVVWASSLADLPLRPTWESPPPAGHEESLAYVDLGLADLEHNPALSDLPELNLDVGPYWDTMWATYFLRDHRLSIQSPNYYVQRPAAYDWTVLPAAPQLSGPSFRPLNERFMLERRFDGPTSEDAAGLDATISADEADVTAPVGATVRVDLTVTNVGTDEWLPPTGTTGAVTVGAHLYDEAGTELAFDYLRAQLVPGRTRGIPPGTTAVVAVDVPVPPIAQGHFEFQMVSELVKWFGSSARIDFTAQPAATVGAR